MKRAYQGSCHCGAVRFEADIDLGDGIRRCNCSFCLKLGMKKALVPYEAVRVLSDRLLLEEYRPVPSHWPEGDINHYYCSTCGAHPLSRAFLEKEMGGHFWAVNVACLDNATEEELAAAPVIFEDGRRDQQMQAPTITAYL